MTARRRTRPTPAADSSQVSHVSARPVLFPDEDPQTYETFRSSLLSDLAPSTPYERVLADNLVAVEWEAIRYRRLRDQYILLRARTVTVQLLSGPMEPRTFPHFEELTPTGPSAQERALGQSLVAGDSAQRAEVEAALQERGHSVAGVMAQAYENARETVGQLERWLVDAENRRRALRRDYDDLRASRAQAVEPAE